MRLLQAANEVRISDRSRQVERGLSKIVKLNYTGLAKKVCPRLRDPASDCGASSRNPGHTFLATSVRNPRRELSSSYRVFQWFQPFSYWISSLE